MGSGAESLELLRDLIVRLRAFDRAILIASRDTAELQRITDRVTLIDRGRVRRLGAPRPATPADVEAVFHLVLHHGGEHVLAVVSDGDLARAVDVRGAGERIAALNRGLRDLLERGALLASVTPAHAGAERERAGRHERGGVVKARVAAYAGLSASRLFHRAAR